MKNDSELAAFKKSVVAEPGKGGRWGQRNGGGGGGRGRICFNYIVNMGNSVTVLAGYQSTELVKIIHDQYQVI